ncbi:MAG: sensor histidine kinase [Proteocatella sp.]
MKFSWKIFFAIMIVSVTCFSFGGYFLIQSNFNSLLKNEVTIAYDFGDIVYHSLKLELANRQKPHFSENVNIKSINTISSIAESMSISNTKEKINFSLLNNNAKILFSSLQINFNKDICKLLNQNKKGYKINKNENGIYIQAVRPANLWGKNYYIETIRDVTFIFENQKEQYKMMIFIMGGMICLVGLLSLIISKLLIQQIVSLSKITENISLGDLSKRVKIWGEDEISALSKNFNKMADDLEEKINELEMEAEKKEMFVAAFSHELKTPLTSIIGYSDTLRRREMNMERVNICANYIFSEGKRLETLSIRLLDLIVLKNQTLNCLPVNIQEFFHEIENIITQELIMSNIKLHIILTPATIIFEPALMKTVFLNLIDNARKALDNNDNGEIKIKGYYIEDKYVIDVQDNGKGMDEFEISKIKEAFYMVDKSRSRKQNGVGLGLSICDQILKLHGYEIIFDSKVGIGTTATIFMKGEDFYANKEPN